MMPPLRAGVPTALRLFPELVPPSMVCNVNPSKAWLGKVMPTLLLPDVPNCPVGSVGMPWFHTVRVNPIRAEFTTDGEKICTQFAPVTLVGKKFCAGKLMASTAVVPSYAVDIE